MSEQWRKDARCRGMDAAEADRIFFPGPTEGHGEPDYTEARAICNACPVREECRAAALATEATTGVSSRFGMFGGLSPRERWGRSRENRADIDRTPVEGVLHGTTTAVRFGHCRCDVCTAAAEERRARYQAQAKPGTVAHRKRAAAEARGDTGECRECGETFTRAQVNQGFCCPQHGTAWRNTHRPTTRAARNVSMSGVA